MAEVPQRAPDRRHGGGCFCVFWPLRMFRSSNLSGCRESRQARKGGSCVLMTKLWPIMALAMQRLDSFASGTKFFWPVGTRLPELGTRPAADPDRRSSLRGDGRSCSTSSQSWGLCAVCSAYKLVSIPVIHPSSLHTSHPWGGGFSRRSRSPESPFVYGRSVPWNRNIGRHGDGPPG